MKLSDFRALTDMKNYDGNNRPVYVVGIVEKVASNGKTYVSITVRDGVSQEQVSIFDTDLDSLTKQYPFFKAGSVVILEISKNKEFYNATRNIKEVTEEVDLSEIAEVATSNPEEEYNNILDTVDEASAERADTKHDGLNKLVRDIYTERKDALLTGSSAIACHHTGIGGNIVHTREVVEMCDKISSGESNSDLDRELLLAGAALHDVGKTTCYETDQVGAATMTLEGYVLGGHHLDAIRAIEEAAKDGNYDEERIMLLKNMVASHHGSREYGDIASPMTMEAIVLHYIDDLDAKKDMARRELEKLKPGEVSSQNVYGLNTRLYRRSDQYFGDEPSKPDEPDDQLFSNDSSNSSFWDDLPFLDDPGDLPF